MSLVKPINGPLNVLRLEGTVGSKKKVIYVFMDIHLRDQLQCRELDGVDFDKYLYQEFKKQKTKVDFFFEIKSKEISMKPFNKNRNIYIWQVNNLFVSSFKKKEKNNNQIEVMSSDIFPNVRLHFIDIRDYLNHSTTHIMDNILNFCSNLHKKGFMTIHDVNKLIDGCNMLGSEMKTLHDLFFGPLKMDNKKMPTIQKFEELEKYSDKDFLNKSKELVNKIRQNYKNKQVKDGVHKIVNSLLKQYFVTFFSIMDEIIKKLNEMKPLSAYPNESLIKVDSINSINYYFLVKKNIFRNFLTFLVSRVEYLYDVYFFLVDLMMDLYFIRRFLDKDYITNGIVYTGANHSEHYLFILIKYFGFKVTHAHYAKGGVKNVNEKFAKFNDITKANEIVFPEKISQCVDMDKFPPLFQ